MPTYRPASVADAPAIAALYRAQFIATFGHLYGATDIEAFFEGKTVEAWAAELADSAFAFRLAEEDGALAGFCKLGPPSLPFTPKSPRRAIELRQLYVASGWHGRGVGPALTEWALAEAAARGADEVYLSVFTDNHRARRHYARYGFEEVGPYKFVVGSIEDDDIVMRLRLTPLPGAAAAA